MTVKNREPQDRKTWGKECCKFCYPKSYFKVGHRRVRRSWKDFLSKQEGRRG